MAPILTVAMLLALVPSASFGQGPAPAPGASQAPTLFASAQAQCARHEWQRCADTLTADLPLAATDSDIYFVHRYRGIAFMALHRWKESIADLLASEKLRPDATLPPLFLGMIYQTTGEKELSDQNFAHASQLDPGLSLSYVHTALKELDAGTATTHQAVINAYIAVRLDPSSGDAQAVTCDAAISEGRLADASSACDAAETKKLQIFLPQAIALDRAIIAYRSGDCTSAEAALLKAGPPARFVPTRELIRRGVIMRCLDYGKSLQYLLAASFQSPKEPEAHYELGSDYYAHGRKADAEAEFAEAIRLDAGAAPRVAEVKREVDAATDTPPLILASLVPLTTGTATQSSASSALQHMFDGGY